MAKQHAWPVSVYNETGKRTVVEDFEVKVGALGITAKVPAGFEYFDGASIPKVLWSSMGHPYTKIYERAALVHDYLYKTPRARTEPPYAEVAATREQIDELFRLLLLQDGVKPRRARTMHWAVHKYGDRHSRFWTETGTPPVELSPAQEAEIARLVKGDALALIELGSAVSFDPSNPPVDPELHAGLSEIDWDAIDPDTLDHFE